MGCVCCIQFYTQTHIYIYMKKALGRLQRDFNIINTTDGGLGVGSVQGGEGSSASGAAREGTELNGETRTATSKQNRKAFDEEHSPPLSDRPLMLYTTRNRRHVYCRRAAQKRAGNPMMTLVVRDDDDTVAGHVAHDQQCHRTQNGTRPTELDVKYNMQYLSN